MLIESLQVVPLILCRAGKFSRATAVAMRCEISKSSVSLPRDEGIFEESATNQTANWT